MSIYTVRVKRTLHHSIEFDVEAEDEEQAKKSAIEAALLKPVNLTHMPPSVIIDKHEVTEVIKR